MFESKPPMEDRERILAYGGPGIGKSTSILNLAQMLSVMDPDAKVWILDADDGLRKLWKAEYSNLTNIMWTHIKTWPDVQQALPEMKKQCTSRDWICIDMIGRFWDMAQSYEVGEVYGQTASEYLLMARADAIANAKMNKPSTLPSVDWNVVKKLHNDDFIDRLTSDFPSSLFVTTSADPVIAGMDDDKTMSLFSATGFKPDGEKRNAYRFDTVMFLRIQRNGERLFTTLKDRARPLMANMKFENLIADYDAALKASNFSGIFSE